MEDKKSETVPMFLTHTLSALIGKFRINVYEDLELIKSKKTVLEAEWQRAMESANGDQERLNELWQSDSGLLKNDLAWLTKKSFKEQIAGLGMNVEQVILLEQWIVKEE